MDYSNLIKQLGKQNATLVMHMMQALEKLEQVNNIQTARIVELEQKVQTIEEELNLVLSDSTNIITTNTDVVLSVDLELGIVVIEENSTVADVIASLASDDESTQTYTVEDSGRAVILEPEIIVLEENVLVVLAEDGNSESVYDITINTPPM